MFRTTYLVILFLVTLSHSWSSLFTVFSFILSTPHIQTHTCSHRYGHISSLIGNTICFLQFPGRMSTATPLYNGIVFSNSFAHIILAFAFKSTREFSLIEVDFRNEHFVYLTLGTWPSVETVRNIIRNEQNWWAQLILLAGLFTFRYIYLRQRSCIFHR